MLEIGKKSILNITRFTGNGAYLSKKGEKEEVLLPKRYVTEAMRAGDELLCFLYLDSGGRLTATTDPVPLTLGGYCVLKVNAITKIGAFLDWGLPKELFLPYGEMTEHPKEGDEILVRLCKDKSSRLCASMKGLYHLLSKNSPYRANDDVKARIYEFGHDFGVFAAVDDRYSAMLPRFERNSEMRIGTVLNCRVTNVKADGKLDLSIREPAFKQMEEDEEALLMLIDEYGGVLPFTEKAAPEVITRETGLSKNAFKRAIGGLYKKRRIDLSDGKIRKTKD